MNQKQKDELLQFIKQTKEVSAAKRAMAVSLLDSGGDVSLTGYTLTHLHIPQPPVVKTQSPSGTMEIFLPVADYAQSLFSMRAVIELKQFSAYSKQGDNNCQ